MISGKINASITRTPITYICFKTTLKLNVWFIRMYDPYIECTIINWVPVKSKSYAADLKLYERIDIFKNIELRILPKKQNKLIHVQYTVEKQLFLREPFLYKYSTHYGDHRAVDFP